MVNKTEVDFPAQQRFFAFILNLRLNSRLFRVLFFAIIAASCLLMGLAIYSLTGSPSWETPGPYRDVTLTVLAPVEIGLAVSCLFFTRQRELTYKLCLPGILLMAGIFSIDAKATSLDLTTYIFIVCFFLVTYQTARMPLNMARRSFASRGLATYSYTFNDEDFLVVVEDLEKHLDEQGEVVTSVNVRESTYRYQDVAGAYRQGAALYLNLGNQSFLIIGGVDDDLAGFLKNNGLAIKEL